MKPFSCFVLLLVYTIYNISSSAIVDEQFQSLLKAGNDLKYRTRVLRRTVEELTDEYAKLSASFRDLRQCANDIDGYHRVDNLEIVGIPELPGEHLLDILRNISLAIGLPFNASDVSAVWRRHEISGDNYYKKTERESVVVRFVSRTTRKRWLLNGRKVKVLNSTQCLSALPESEIFINEHLTNMKKSLIKFAKQLEDNGKILYAWVKDGHLYIRQTSGGRAIKIRSMYDLEGLGLAG